jgi:hypothetical protein
MDIPITIDDPIKAHREDLRLRKVYGISLDQYNEILAKQGGVCKICGRPPKNNRLSVDHDHRVRRIKFKPIRSFSPWGFCVEARESYAQANSMLPEDRCYAELKCDALQRVEKLLKLKSVRGLLCVNCNRGLRWFSDNPQILREAAQYLETFLEELFHPPEAKEE